MEANLADSPPHSPLAPRIPPLSADSSSTKNKRKNSPDSPRKLQVSFLLLVLPLRLFLFSMPSDP